MAARIRKVKLTDDWKRRIQAGVILDRLNKHVMDQIGLSRTQIDAAKIILSKMVPDLARTELTGANGGPLVVVQSTKEDEKL